MIKNRNRAIWFTVACMFAAFWLAWRCIGSEYNTISIIAYWLSGAYLTAFAYSNRNYLLKLLLGAKKKSHKRGNTRNS